MSKKHPSDDDLSEVLANIISMNCGDDGCWEIKHVNSVYSRQYESKYGTLDRSKYRTLFSFFRSQKERFVFHKISPGNHKVSVHPDYKFTKIGGSEEPTKKPEDSKSRRDRVNRAKLQMRAKLQKQINKKEKEVADVRDQFRTEEVNIFKKELDDVLKEVDDKGDMIKKLQRENKSLKLEFKRRRSRNYRFRNVIKKGSKSDQEDQIKRLEEQNKLLKKLYEEKMKETQRRKEEKQPQKKMIEKDTIFFTEEFDEKNCELFFPKKFTDLKKNQDNKFKVYVPDAQEVSIIIDDDDWIPLTKLEDQNDIYQEDIELEDENFNVEMYARFADKAKPICMCKILFSEYEVS